MPLANFFDKAVLAASHVLRGFDPAAFEEFLVGHPVGLAFDARAASSFEGRATLELAASLLARLYPRLALVPLEPSAAPVAEWLAAECRRINPDIEIGTSTAGVSIGLVVGDRRADGPERTVYLGSDGWVVKVSPDGPVGCGQTDNPFGAAGAACFGAANAFRLLFAGQLPHGGPDVAFALSLLDCDREAPEPANPAVPDIDIGTSHLVGLGAIGNGAIWALARLGAARGALTVIDEERIDPSNLQRYVLAGQADVGSTKVAVATRALAGTRLTVHPFPGRWGAYLRETRTWDLERVLVALDSAADRIAVQASLPGWAANAWTQPGDLGVSRHTMADGQACLACLYLPDGPQPNEDELVARAIGMPDAVREVRELLYSGGPVGPEFIDRIAAALKVPAEALRPYAGRPIRAFYAEAVCGGTILRLVGSGGAAPPAAEVPMAFQSALAGVLLAAELVAHSAGLKGPAPPTVTRINLLRPLGQVLTFAEAKRPGGRCLCQDPDYVEAFRKKFADPGPPVTWE